MTFGGVVWQLITRGKMFGQDVLNVYYYGDESSGGNASDLEAAFEADVLPAILDAINSDFVMRSIDVQGVQGVSDLYTKVINQNGTRNNESLPVFNAFSYRLGRAATNLRNGYKRFAGVDEGDQANGNATPAWISTRGIPLGIALGATIPSSGPTYVPLIRTTRRDKLPLPTPEYNIIGAIQFVGISTQNTRKAGHGS